MTLSAEAVICAMDRSGFMDTPMDIEEPPGEYSNIGMRTAVGAGLQTNQPSPALILARRPLRGSSLHLDINLGYSLPIKAECI